MSKKFLHWRALLLFLLCHLLYGNDTSSHSGYFGNISVISDTLIQAENFDSFLEKYRFVPFNEKNYDQLTGQILQIPVTKGFLFPLLTLSEIHPKSRADSLFINPIFQLSWGDAAIIDTLYFGNLSKTSPHLLYKDLKYLQGKVYSSQSDEFIRQNLQRYDFLSFDNCEIVKTNGGKFGLLVRILEKEANRFSGVAGYVPKTSAKKGYFTGEIDIALKNISGKGRGANIYWSKVNENSQELKLNYFEPHLLKSNFFTNIGFQQTLRDTLVVIRNINFGLGRNIFNRGILEITGDYETTLPTPAGKEMLGLMKSKIFKGGINYRFDNRDLPANPSRGFYLNTHHYLGFRRQEKSQKQLLQTAIYLEHNHSLSNHFILHLKADYEAKFIRNGTLDYSDQLWFGGANSLRGYAEDFFAGSETGILSGELRWITGHYSRIFIFFDQGYYKSIEGKIFQPFSFGIGMRLESRMGTIGLDYAFGEDDTFTTAKIHLHLENRF